MVLRRGGYPLAEFWLAWLLMLGAMVTICSAADSQTAPAIVTTAVTDTVYHADGTPAGGTVLISWPSFSTLSGQSVPAGSTSAAIGSGGALNVNLVPNAGSTPMGSYYTVIYHLDDGSVTREYWVVPVSTNAVAVSTLRSTVLPASVALQTVSKAYVDAAVARAVAGAGSGTPLDGSTPYVLKSGDTMSGPLTLPGDPVAPLQAADMSYVDTQVAGVAGGLSQKVSMLPSSGQTVTQPPGTELDVNKLNDVLNASQYVTGAGNNGISNAAASPDCASGCEVKVEQSYPATEQARPSTWNNRTHVEDSRGGANTASYLNPLLGGFNAAQTINVTSTESAASVLAETGSGQIFSQGLAINSNALAGGSNVFPAQIQGTVPYFKTTFGATSFTGNNNTLGQHVLMGAVQNCYGVGDCLLGSQVINASGGFRDEADEGSHPFDRLFTEDARVFTGSCSQGCAPGSTSVQIAGMANAGTQGEGRYLIDTRPSLAITTGSLIGPGPSSGRQPGAVFTGTNFPVSVFLETTQTIPTQSNNIVPGTVVVPIATSAVPAGFATNTAALPSASGVACVSDITVIDTRPLNFETAVYTVVDGSHLQMTLNRPHGAGATIAVGGLCGYGLEQKVDTIGGIRQVFPVIGSDSPTTLLYAGGATSNVGMQGYTSGFLNTSLAVASISRTNNVVTVTSVANFFVDLNGLTVNVQNVADPSYNGSFAVTTTGPNTLTYTDNGPNSTSSGGNLSYLTGSYGLYPMAEVLSVFNTATRAVDGLLTLAANTVPWAAGDPVEQPHYFQEDVGDDTDNVTQYTPRAVRRQSAGIQYNGNNGPGLVGFHINNTDGASSYYGNGGTHGAPDIGIQIEGVWAHSMEMQAGENTLFDVHCNSHGCGKWNSGYNLFLLDSNAGEDSVTYTPQTSTLNFLLNGGFYSFAPQGLTTQTINVNTLNATTVNGHFQGTVAASSLPVFAASGSSHAEGAVPDPGSTPGTTRFLREDGTWSVPVGSGGSASISATYDASSNPLAQARSNVASCAYGLHVEGDSNSVAGYGTPAVQGWEPQLLTDCGLTPNVGNAISTYLTTNWEYALGGNEMADVSWSVFTRENPGDFGNPLVTMLDIGGNNSTFDPNDTVGFQQDAYAALTWPAISSTNKVVMGTNPTVSHSGTCTVDTAFPNANGLTCTAGAVVSWTASVGPQGVAYFYSKSLPTTAGSGTFALSSGSTVLTDSITSGSAINPYIPAVRWYPGFTNTVCAGGGPCGAIASRYAGLTYGPQTFHATVLTGSVTFLAFGAPAMNTNASSPSGPRVLMSDIPHRIAYTNDAGVLQFDALDLGIAQTLLTDKLNVPYLEMLSAIDVLNDYATTATINPNCSASNNSGHWNNCGQNHALAAIEAAIGLTPQNPNPLVTSMTASGAVTAASIQTGPVTATGTVKAPTLAAGYNNGTGWVAGTLGVFNASGGGYNCLGTTDGSNFVNCYLSAQGMYVNNGGSPITFTGQVNQNGGTLQTPQINNPSFYINGFGSGFTGNKTVGSCVFQINSGIITNVSGC